MLLNLYAIDSSAFRLVNSGNANGLFDIVMPFVTEPTSPFLYILIPSLLALALWTTRRRSGAEPPNEPAPSSVNVSGRMRVLWCVLLAAAAITVGDRVNSAFIKNWVGRERPCHTLADVRQVCPCGAGKSFPSSHAVNLAAFAVIAGYFFRRFAPWGAALALLICYSRVYVGVHYPADVLGGALLGAAVAALLLWIWRGVMLWAARRRAAAHATG